jgi:hypothetical protein
MLEKEPNFANAVINADDFNFAFKIDNIDADRASGSLTIDGKSLPKVNTPDLISKLSGKSISQAGKIIEKEVSSVYKYQISTNIKFLESINPLPFIKKQIKITLKS